MGKKTVRKVKARRLYPVVCNIDLSYADSDEIFFAVLRQERSIFRQGNEDRAGLLRRLWKHVRPRTKEEALWNENFRARMDEWGVSYEQDLIDLDIPEDITEDDDEDDE